MIYPLDQVTGSQVLFYFLNISQICSHVYISIVLLHSGLTVFYVNYNGLQTDLKPSYLVPLKSNSVLLPR